MSVIFLEDYHIHSRFSFDGKETIHEIASAAADKGISEIAVTDHLELAAGMDCCWEELRGRAFDEIDREAEAWKGKLVIRKGMELGNPHLEPEEAERQCRSFQGDFIIGSVHNLEPMKDVMYEHFQEIDCRKFVSEYLAAVERVASSADYDVLGHITYPFKSMYEQTGQAPGAEPWLEQYREIFRTVIRRGKGIEINTSGLRTGLKRLLPDHDILKLYRQCGGIYITVGSDAHRKEDVGEGIPEAMRELRLLGYECCTVYRRRQPQLRSILQERQK